MEERLSGRQGACIMALFVIGSTLITESTHSARQDAWLALLMSFVAALPMLLIYWRIQSAFRGSSLYEIAFALCGRVGGAVITALYVLFFSYTVAVIAQRFILFAHLTTLDKTPNVVLALLVCLLATQMALLRENRFGRACTMLFALVVVEMLMMFALSLDEALPEHLLPILEASPAKLADEAFSFFSVPLAQTAVFLCMFQLIPERAEHSRAWFAGTAIGVLTIAVNLVRVAMVLGGEAMGSLYLTTFMSSSAIGLESFLQRLEVILSNAFFLSLVVKVSVYLRAACNGCVRLFPKANYRAVLIALTAAVTAAAMLMTKSISMANRIFGLYRYIGLFFHVLLPVVFWIWGEIILRRQRKRPAAA